MATNDTSTVNDVAQDDDEAAVDMMEASDMQVEAETKPDSSVSATSHQLHVAEGETLSKDDNYDDDDNDSQCDSMDRKPAAAVDDNDEASNVSSSSDDDSDSSEGSTRDNAVSEDAEAKEKGISLVDEEGRPLSEYEIQRLERIKRNKDLLTQLGLQGKGDGSGVLGGKKKNSAPRKSESLKNDQVNVKRRQTISRKTKLNRKSYKEPSKSIRSLLRETEGGTSTTSASKKKPPPKSAPKKPRVERMSKEVYDAFQQAQARRRNLFQQAQRNVRNAEKEVKYWQKRQTAATKPGSRKREDLRERRALEGKTAREFIQIVDERMPEITEVIHDYENAMTAGQKEKERDYNRLVAEEKVRYLDALDRFPVAIKVRDRKLTDWLVCHPLTVSSNCYFGHIECNNTLELRVD